MPLGPFAITLLIGLGPAGAAAERTAPEVVATYAKLPLHFEANQGQTDSRVEFLARAHGYTLFLTAGEAVLVAAEPARATQESEDRGRLETAHPTSPRVLRMAFQNATPRPRIGGRDALLGKVHYLTGNDPRRWRTHVPTYARVQYREIYPGIDLVFHGDQDALEYDFVLAPGADPRAIRLRFGDAERLEVDSAGDLVVHTPTGPFRQRKPTAYQGADGARTHIPSRFQLHEDRQVGFDVGAHDARRPLVIDPVLVYATYIGGNGTDSSRGVALDKAGNAYVTGTTSSTNFPVAGAPFQGTYGGGVSDAFVAKLSPSGSSLVYATYLGGSADEQANAIAVDDAGRAHVAGFTASGNFPTKDAIQPVFGGPPIDGFVTRLTPGGDALVFSTYLGGTALDVVNGVAVDRSDNVYVSVRSGSSNLPTTPGAFQPAFAGAEDAYVAKLRSDGSLRYATYLGGSGVDIGRRIAVDRAGRAYVTGRTGSTNFPITSKAVQTTYGGGGADAFVTKLNAAGSALVYSTYLGGSGDDDGSGIGLSEGGRVTMGGWTNSADYPTTPRAFQTTYGGGVFDVIVTKLDGQGSRLVYSTYLGGSGMEMSFFGLAVDRCGRAHVTGNTQSTNFPVERPLPGGGALRGPSDAFVTKFDSSGSGLVYSTYLGGTAGEGSQGIAVGNSGDTYVAGTTGSADFPVTAGAFQTTFVGAPNDVFVARISDRRRHGHGHGHGHDVVRSGRHDSDDDDDDDDDNGCGDEEEDEDDDDDH